MTFRGDTDWRAAGGGGHSHGASFQCALQMTHTENPSAREPSRNRNGIECRSPPAAAPPPETLSVRSNIRRALEFESNEKQMAKQRAHRRIECFK